MSKKKPPRLPTPRKGRTVSDDEKADWQNIAEGVKPISRKRIDPPAPPSRVNPVMSPKAVPPPRAGEGKAISFGDYSGIDHRNAQAFRTGARDIEATLDLHGMTVEQAHPALEKFIQRASLRGQRMLLIVTGKGREDKEGILKQMVRRWLTSEPLSDYLLAVDDAQIKDGGKGAYYVLLRRNR